MARTSFPVSSMPAAAMFSAAWSGEPVPGIGSIAGELASSQASDDLVLGHAEPPGGGQHADVLVRLLDRRPRQEHQRFLLAQVEHRLATDRSVTLYLFCTDTIGTIRCASRELLLRHVRHADVPDLALSFQLGERADDSA